MRATIDAVERGLSDERELLDRYRGGDGFAEPEGTFPGPRPTTWPGS